MSKPVQRQAKPAKPRRTAEPPVYGRAAPIHGPTALAAATAALLALDPVRIGPLLAVTGPPPLRLREPGFAGLAMIVVGQQVSTASAEAIYNRLVAAVAPLTAAAFLATDEATLKAVGLSMPKVRALHAIAQAILGGTLDFGVLATLSAEEAHRTLVGIKGIGPWTADVFLLFCLGHPDALPAGDVALQEGARLAFGLPTRPTPVELVALAESWRPYRGVAARLLWTLYRLRRKGQGGITLDSP